jgi:integration host factor subunit beta
MSGAGLDLREARELTGRIIGALADALAAGEAVELRGLGSLEVREHGERLARKPRTGEVVSVPSRRYVLFHPGSELKAAFKFLSGRYITGLTIPLLQAIHPNPN